MPHSNLLPIDLKKDLNSASKDIFLFFLLSFSSSSFTPIFKSRTLRGFGGIGGILRWKVDFAEMEMAADLDQTTEETALQEDFDDIFI